MNNKIYLTFIIIMISSDIALTQNVDTKIAWHSAAELPSMKNKNRHLGVAGPLAGIDNGMLFVGGGANFPDAMPWEGGEKRFHDDLYVYKFEDSGELQLLAKTFKLPNATAYGANCSTNRGIVYAGGQNDKGLSSNVLLINWDCKNKAVVYTNLPKLPFPMTNSSIIRVNNILYLVGGETENGALSVFISLDLDNLSQGWIQLPPLPKAISNTVVLAQKNEIFVLGGRKSNSGSTSTLYKSSYRFDINNNEWLKKSDMPYALSAGTGAVFADDKILLFGGDKGETFSRTEALIASINKEENPLRKADLIQQKARLQNNHPGFSKDVLEYDIKKDEWLENSVLPFDAPVTTSAIKYQGQVIIPTGEIKAGVRTPHIWVGKFIENNQGEHVSK